MALSSATINSHNVTAVETRRAMKALGGGLVGGGTQASLSDEAGAVRARISSAMVRKSTIMVAASSQMDATNWAEFSRRCRVEDDDGTTTGERSSVGAFVGSTVGNAAAARGATSMEGAVERGAGNGIGWGMNWQGTIGRQVTMAKVRG